MVNSSSFSEISFQLSWQHSYRAMPLQNGTGPGAKTPQAEEMSVLLLNLQYAYESICIGLDYPTNGLELQTLIHPNMSISLKGLGEPIRALKDLIASAPEIVVSFCTIRKQVQAKNQELERKIVLDKAVADIVRRGMMAYRISEEDQKISTLEEFLIHELDDLDCNPMQVMITDIVFGNAPRSVESSRSSETEP